MISLIIKKESYKDLRPILNQIAKQKEQSIKNSISSINQILTKQYNAQSRLYALRFLKDCFEMGSPKFIKLTQQTLLPLIVNIVIDSTDQTAITKYAGSSFTKTTDLQKFKSIIVSFFKLAKECVMKWAQWIPNSQYKFKSAFVSLQKKGIRFQYELKYFREENQTNFLKNCKQNGIVLDQKKDNNTQKSIKKQESAPIGKALKPQTPQQPIKKQLSHQQNNSLNKSKQAEREKRKVSATKSKNKYIIQCHEMFKTYEQKLSNKTITKTDVEEMKDRINEKLSQYLATPGLNQNQMETQLEIIFQKIKFITDDVQLLQQNKKQTKVNSTKKSQQSSTKNAKQIESNSQKNKKLIEPIVEKSNKDLEHVSQKSQKKFTSKKTQPLLNSQTKIKQKEQFEDQIRNISKQELEKKKIVNFDQRSIETKQKDIIVPENRQSKHRKQETSINQSLNSNTQKNRSVKKVQPISSSNRKQTNKNFNKDESLGSTIKQRQVFDDDSFLQSRVQTYQPPTVKNQMKPQTKKSVTSTKPKQIQQTKNKMATNHIQNKIQSNSDKSIQFQLSGTSKQKQKSNIKQKFGSNLSISRSQSSRVNFSQSSDQDSSNNEQESKITGVFKRQGLQLKLSSIAEQQHDGFGQTSRKNFTKVQQGSLPSKDSIKQKTKQDSLQNTEAQLFPKKIIDQYQNKISILQKQLKSKQSGQKQLAMKLNQLNKLKQIQEQQLQKVKSQNNKILKQFSNVVNAQQYNQVKKQFQALKVKNKRIEQNMDKLVRQIDLLKKDKNSQSRNIHQASFNNSKDSIQPFKSSQNLPKQRQYNSNKSNKKSQPNTINQQKQKIVYEILDNDYKNGKTHLSKIYQMMDQNNLTILKKNILGANQLFYNSEQMSFICRTSPFNNEKLALKLQISFQLKSPKPKMPIVRIPNLQQIDVWKKNIVGQQSLYHQEIVVKLKKFPFKLLKMQVSQSQIINSTVLLPFIYYSFLKKGQFKQDQIDSIFQANKDCAIKSKVFNLNPKTVKDLKTFHFYQGFKLSAENRICAKLIEQSQKSRIFWIQIINLTKQKCFIKIFPEPFNEQMCVKSEQIIQNLQFLIGI